MKRIITCLIIVFACIGLIEAQVPQGMKYKAIAKDEWGVSLPSKTITLQFTIYNDDGNVYVEVHHPTTNKFGLVDAVIGEGDVILGAFETINWAEADYNLKVELDPKGGNNYTVVGSDQLLSVPYALYAGNTSAEGQYYYADRDGDGFGDNFNAAWVPLAQTEPSGYIEQGGDFNDEDASMYPGAPEICGDGIDQDGDGIDPPCAYSHTITIDGINDFNSNEEFGSPTHVHSYYISWDDTYLYLGVERGYPQEIHSFVCAVYIGNSGEPSTSDGWTVIDQSPQLPMEYSYLLEWYPRADYSLYQLQPGDSWTVVESAPSMLSSDKTFSELRVPLAYLGNPENLDIHISRVRVGFTYDPIPIDSFVEGDDPDYTKYYQFDLNSTDPPNTYTPLP